MVYVATIGAPVKGYRCWMAYTSEIAHRQPNEGGQPNGMRLRRGAATSFSGGIARENRAVLIFALSAESLRREPEKTQNMLLEPVLVGGVDS